MSFRSSPVLTVSRSAKHRTVTDWSRSESIRVVHRHRHRAVPNPSTARSDRSRSPARDDDRQRRSPLKGPGTCSRRSRPSAGRSTPNSSSSASSTRTTTAEATRLELGLADAIETHSEISYEPDGRTLRGCRRRRGPFDLRGIRPPALAKALACGVPVVATTGGGFPGSGRRHGVPSSNRAIRTLAGAVRDLLEDDRRRRTLANRDESESSRSSTGSETARKPLQTCRNAIETRANRGTEMETIDFDRVTMTPGCASSMWAAAAGAHVTPPPSGTSRRS